MNIICINISKTESTSFLQIISVIIYRANMIIKPICEMENIFDISCEINVNNGN